MSMEAPTRLEVAVAIPVLGVPIPDSENPVIAAPAGVVRFEIASSPECRADVGDVDDALAGFADNLLKGINTGHCASVRRIGSSSYSGLPLYAAATVALVYWIAEAHGEHLSPHEILELASVADPFSYDRSWHPVLSSARLASAEGRVAVYRNEEEMALYGGERIEAERAGSPVRVEARVSRERIGMDTYNALVHLAGVAVLEAAVRLGEGRSLASVAEDLKPVQDGVANIVWGLGDPGGGCLWTPDMPGYFTRLCIGGGGG
ncbi:hypothetical protein APE_1769.1 [Aeropyrum pernix K1]|uniref:GHMP kinase N-terminal domain-containing protein n=1 Tax=Aeropyrum pernix (strain ATCC 700893 / DSM 11879 / JCM 9820 / NBRC 100138 / K1) TaxID=272557 RepID=Q9YB26_AERPE|nr:hypothetical protein [Aeropyrum pernix]BAA80772.2 hypothetical protein APE_1769.1 [Aeropyrum pernix K1]